AKFEKQDTKFDKLASDMDAKFEKQDTKFDKLTSDMDAKFEKQASDMDAKFEKQASDMDAKIDKQASDMKENFDELKRNVSGNRKDMNSRMDRLEGGQRNIVDEIASVKNNESKFSLDIARWLFLRSTGKKSEEIFL
ncbi:MAG: hypothetical protein LBE04_06330, partial [Prevotellaceae bacterium]|nr:hypothetical protein [Prevotellaceae bacterium]